MPPAFTRMPWLSGRQRQWPQGHRRRSGLGAIRRLSRRRAGMMINRAGPATCEDCSCAGRRKWPSICLNVFSRGHRGAAPGRGLVALEGGSRLGHRPAAMRRAGYDEGPGGLVGFSTVPSGAARFRCRSLWPGRRHAWNQECRFIRPATDGAKSFDYRIHAPT